MSTPSIKGATATELAAVPCFTTFQDLNSQSKYCVSDFIKKCSRTTPQDIDTLINEPPGFDFSTAVWLFEHLRQICRDLGLLLVELNADVCTAASCPEMIVTDKYHYLCAAHVGTNSCSAMDYSVHTLEGTVSSLNSVKIFPNCNDIDNKQIPKFRTMLRRLYRILAHAHFHHPQTFASFETKTCLTLRLHRLAIKYQLIPAEQLIIPGLRWRGCAGCYCGGRVQSLHPPTTCRFQRLYSFFTRS